MLGDSLLCPLMLTTFVRERLVFFSCLRSFYCHLGQVANCTVGLTLTWSWVGCRMCTLNLINQMCIFFRHASLHVHDLCEVLALRTEAHFINSLVKY